MQLKCGEFTKSITRKKILDNAAYESELSRCLGTADLVLLAIGYMLSSEVYIIITNAARDHAGPAIIISLIFTGLTAYLAAICYAELSTLYPRAGSAYSYTYLCLGELAAFTVGWSIVLENVIGNASTGRTCSQYLDSILDKAIENNTNKFFGEVYIFDAPNHLDFVAVAIILVFTIFLSFGVKSTSYLNNIFTFLNMIIFMIVIGVGYYLADIDNWTNPETGGFMPYGISGVLEASGTCFFLYIGFDCIACAGEEVRDPRQSIPRATIITMTIATLIYINLGAIITLIDNHTQIVDLHEAFTNHGMGWAKYMPVIGVYFSMITAMIGGLYAMSRIVYTMAGDGLIFKYLSKVNNRVKIPLRAMLIFGFLSAIIAFVLDLYTLIEMLSIGTLYAYTGVSISLLKIRYTITGNSHTQSYVLEPQTHVVNNYPSGVSPQDIDGRVENKIEDNLTVLGKLFRWFHNKFKQWRSKLRELCQSYSTLFITCYCLFVLIGCWIVKLYYNHQGNRTPWWVIVLLALLAVGATLCIVMISLLRQENLDTSYKVPFVPLLPALSIFFNCILLVNLEALTWLRLVIWILIGLLIYFFYGIRHSVERGKEENAKSDPRTVRNISEMSL